MINDHMRKAIPLMENGIHFTVIITQSGECIGFKMCVYFLQRTSSIFNIESGFFIGNCMYTKVVCTLENYNNWLKLKI